MNESRAAFVPTTSFAKVVGPFAKGVPSRKEGIPVVCPRQISIDDLYFSLNLDRRDTMANLWTVSLDDSGDKKKEKYVIAGSLFGNKTAWKDFNKAWRSALHAPPRIEHFHQKELTSLDGEFLQFRDDAKWPMPTGSQAANMKREALSQAILNSDLQCHGLLIGVPDYLDVRSSEPNAKLFLDPNPWIYLLQEVAFDTARLVLHEDPKANIAFISDDSNKAQSDRYLHFYRGFKMKNPEIAERMLGLTHGNDKLIYSLQASDLIAADVKKFYDELLNPQKPGNPKTPKHLPLEKFAKIATITKERLVCVIAKQAINRL